MATRKQQKGPAKPKVRPRAAPVEALEEAMDLPAAYRLGDVSAAHITELSDTLRDARDPRALTLDEVAKRHVNREEPSRYHGSRAVPPEDPPDRRDGPTFGPVKMIFDDPDIPDQSDERIRSLEDLMARFPFSGPMGDYFVRVVRTAPRTYMGMNVLGVLRKVVDQITYEQFVELYGGGTYELTVYGPPKGPGVIDPATGKVQPKALTRPVSFTVPYDKDGVFGMAPNPSASIPDQDEHYPMESPMQRVVPVQTSTTLHPFSRGPMRVTTPADAKIHEADLEHERAEKIREQDRTALEADSRKTIELEKMRMKERADERALNAERARADAEAERRREVEEQMREQAREVREQKQGQAVDVPELIKAVGLLKGDGGEVKLEFQRQAEAHKMEITRIMEDQKRELARLEEANKRDLERERSVSEEKARIAREETQRERDRAERSIRDADERAEKRVRDAEDRSERRVEEVRRDFERQLALNTQMWEGRLRDEQRNNERDLTSRKDSQELALRAEKVTFETQLRAAENELTRLREENARLRTDVDQKGDVVAQVQKVTEVAEALGFRKDSGADDAGEEGDKPPTDWKQLAAGIGMNLAQNLPDLIRSAGDAVSTLRNNRTAAAASPAQQVQHPVQQNPPQMGGGAPRSGYQPRQRLTFANENDPAAPINFEVPMLASPPLYDHPPPMQQPDPQPVMSQSPVLMQQPPPPPAAPRYSAPPPAAMQSQPPPQSMPPQADAAQDGLSEDDRAINEQILVFRKSLEQSVEDDVSPAAFTQGLVELVGPEAVRAYAKVLSADRIMAVVQAQPDGSKSNLLKAQGRNWLKGFEAAARAV